MGFEEHEDLSSSEENEFEGRYFVDDKFFMLAISGFFGFQMQLQLGSIDPDNPIAMDTAPPADPPYISNPRPQIHLQNLGRRW